MRKWGVSDTGPRQVEKRVPVRRSWGSRYLWFWEEADGPWE